MYMCTHASKPGTTARQRPCEVLMQTQEALHVSFLRRNQTTFSTSNAKTLLYPLPETPKPPQHPIPCFQHTLEQLTKMAPCVVVEKLEGKQRCSRAPPSEHAELQAREWPKWLFTEKRKVNEEQPNPQQPIKQLRQRSAQRTFAHLHWCGANPPSSWLAYVAGHTGDPPKRDYIFAIFAGFSYNQ